MSEFEVLLDLLSKLKRELEDLRAKERIRDYLLEDVFFQKEPQSTVFKVTLDFYVNVKKEIQTGEEGK